MVFEKIPISSKEDTGISLLNTLTDILTDGV